MTTPPLIPPHLEKWMTRPSAPAGSITSRVVGSHHRPGPDEVQRRRKRAKAQRKARRANRPVARRRR